MVTKAKIKTWNNMKKEFGIDDATGGIQTKFIFTPEMEAKMPKDRIVEISMGTDKLSCTVLDGCMYFISKEMVESYIEERDMLDSIQHHIEKGDWNTACDKFMKLNVSREAFKRFIEFQDDDSVLNWAMLGFHTRLKTE